MLKRFRGLSGKILALAAVSMIAAIIISQSATAYFDGKFINSKIDDNLNSIAEAKRDQFDLAFSNLASTALATANNPYASAYFTKLHEDGIVDKSKEEVLGFYLNNLLKNSGGLYENVFYGYDSKIHIDGIEGHSIGHVFEDATEPWYRSVMGNQVYIGNAWPSPITGRPTNIIACPVVDYATGEVVGAFATAVELNELAKVVFKTTSDSAIHAMAINSAGLVISSDNADQILKLDLSKDTGTLNEFYKKTLEFKSGIDTFDLDGVHYKVSYARSASQDMTILTYVEEDEVLAEYRTMLKSSVGGLFFIVLVFSIIILFATKKVVTPITEVSKHLNIMAQGDFSSKLDGKYFKIKDETGELARSMSAMQEKIEHMVRTIKEESDKMFDYAGALTNSMVTLNSQVEDVSATTEELSASTEETASASEELSASTVEVEGSVNEIAEKAMSSKKSTEVVRDRAKELMNNANAASKVADEMRSNIRAKMSSAIEESKGVTKINELTEAILQISSQTNLLALNASIEAARAGEYGRGFAVVADEIRKLAEQSKSTVNQIQSVTQTVVSSVGNLNESATEILEFIDNEVISDYKVMVETCEDYYKNTSSIVGLVSDFNESAISLNYSIAEMAKTMNQIAVANNESARGTESIANNIEHVSSSSHDVAQIAHETKESTERLNALVSKFKV